MRVKPIELSEKLTRTAPADNQKGSYWREREQTILLLFNWDKVADVTKQQGLKSEAIRELRRKW
jgi:hypothetical protein